MNRILEKKNAFLRHEAKSSFSLVFNENNNSKRSLRQPKGKSVIKINVFQNIPILNVASHKIFIRLLTNDPQIRGTKNRYWPENRQNATMQILMYF